MNPLYKVVTDIAQDHGLDLYQSARLAAKVEGLMDEFFAEQKLGTHAEKWNQ